jgi:hypothetical protein
VAEYSETPAPGSAYGAKDLARPEHSLEARQTEAFDRENRELPPEWFDQRKCYAKL